MSKITQQHLQVLLSVLQRAPVSVAEQMVVQEVVFAIEELVDTGEEQTETVVEEE